MARCAFLVPGSGFRVQGQEIGHRAKGKISERLKVKRNELRVAMGLRAQHSTIYLHDFSISSHNLINSSCVISICLIIFFKRGMPISLPPCGFGINILCFPLIMY
jgi:hypothetical protein